MGGYAVNIRFLSFIVLCFAICMNSNNSFGQNESPAQLIAEGLPEDIRANLLNNPDINANINDLGWTYLHAAVNFRRDDVVKILVEMQADLNIKDSSGKTPLFLAVETGQYKTVDFLIGSGADVNIANNNGENPLSMAQKIGLNNITNLLLQNNAQPVQQNQRLSGNRVGFPGMRVTMPEGITNPGGPAEPGNNPYQPAPEMMNNDYNQNVNDIVKIDLDPNEVKERISKYEGLAEEVLKVAEGSDTELRQWRRVDKDNRENLVNPLRRQYQSEVEFIKKIANQEEAKKTAELAEELRGTRREAFMAIYNMLKDSDSSSTTRTTTNSRRSGRTNNRTIDRSTTRTNRRGSNANETYTNTQVEEKTKYSAEVQSEIDKWKSSDITDMNTRINLLEYVNDIIVTEINSLKEAAKSEKSEKTVAAIDGLLLARQIGFKALNKEFQEENQEDIQ